jgi:hypothetical protein
MTQIDIFSGKIELTKKNAQEHPVLKHYPLSTATAVVNAVLDFFNMGMMSQTDKSVVIPEDMFDDYVIFPKDKLRTYIEEVIADEKHRNESKYP